MKRPVILQLAIICILSTFASGLSAQSTKKYLSFEQQQLKSSSAQDNIQAILQKSATEPNTYSLLLPGANVYSTITSAGAFHQLYMEGLSPFGDAGSPGLPAKNLLIRIPKGAAPSIEILELDTIVHKNINIAPNLPPEKDLLDIQQEHINEKQYQTDAFYPNKWVEIIDIQTQRDISYALVQIHPVQFNPVKKQIKVARQLRFKVNVPELKSAQSLNTTEPPNYLILAPKTYAEAAHTWLNWKNQSGFKADLVLQENWTINKIRSTIQSKSNSTPPDYLLFIGDHEQLPAESFYREDDGELKLYVSDLYYACLDGEDDYTPDMAYGRLPVSSPEEAQQVVNKLINYAKHPPLEEAYYKTVIGCAQFQDEDDDGKADRRFVQTSEDIGDYLKTKNYTYKRIYYAEDGVTPKYYNDSKYSSGGELPTELLRSSGFKWDGDAAQINAAINAGSFFTFHRDHGLTSGLGWAHPEYTVEHLEQLENENQPTILYSINCHSGKFNVPESFAEAMLLHHEGGAVAAFCATNTSFSGYNDAMIVAMVDAVWNDPGVVPDLGSDNYSQLKEHDAITDLGNILTYGKMRMLEQWSGNLDTHQHIFELFHLFGDPSMHMPTAVPQIINATIPDWLPEPGNNLQVSSSNCSSAYVSITTATGEVIHGDYLSEGNISFSWNDIQEDSIICTLTKEGFVPLIKTIKQAQPILAAPASMNLSILTESQFPYTHEFTLKNVGTGSLNIQPLTASNSALTFSPGTELVLNSDESITIYLNIESAVRGTHKDSITVTDGTRTRYIPVVYTCATKPESTNGMWTKSHSPYIIDQNITVASEDHLVIEAGTEILFSKGATFNIQGSLEALGTAQEPVTFRNLEQESWKGLSFLHHETNSSTLEHCTISGVAKKDGYGGAVYIENYPNVHFSHCRFVDNTSEKGGGVYATNTQATFTNCLFDNNAAEYGGALYILEANIKVSNSILSNNKSILYGGSGGGIYCKTADPLIEGCLIHNNYAAFAGGIYLRDESNALLVNNTISGNLSNYGAGIRIKTDCDPKIYNSILWKNEAFSGGNEIYAYEDCEPRFIHCIVEGGKEKIRIYQDKVFTGSLENCSTDDPEFTNEEESNFSLSSSSPAKDNGTNSVSQYTFPEKDIQGGERIRYDGIDMGAKEFQNYAPTQIRLSCDSLMRGLEAGELIGLLLTEDQDVDGTYQYTLHNEAVKTLFSIRNDSLFAAQPLVSLSSDVIDLDLESTDQGFGHPTCRNWVNLKLSDSNTSQIKSLSPIKTTLYPKDTTVVLSEYFKTKNSSLSIQYEIGEISHSSVASASLEDDQLHISYKEVGRSYLPLTTVCGNETTNYSIAIEVWGPNAVNIPHKKVLKTYPNPCRHTLFIEAKAELQEVIASVFDMQGRKILTQTLLRTNGQQLALPVSNLESGMYLLQLENKQGILQSSTFVKE
jgi:parallel beta-helix repeat protein